MSGLRPKFNLTSV